MKKNKRNIIQTMLMTFGIGILASSVYAGVAFIGESKQITFEEARKVLPTVFSCPEGQDLYQGKCINQCNRSIYLMTEVPDANKGKIDSCTDAQGTYYAYTECYNGWDLIQGNCVATDCSGFTYTSDPGSLAGTVTSCKSGTETLYKYTDCNPGWDYSNGVCSIHICDSIIYPFNSEPDKNIGKIETCKAGVMMQYGYSACYEGYKLENHNCVADKSDPVDCAPGKFYNTDGKCYDNYTRSDFVGVVVTPGMLIAPEEFYGPWDNSNKEEFKKGQEKYIIDNCRGNITRGGLSWREPSKMEGKDILTQNVPLIAAALDKIGTNFEPAQAVFGRGSDNAHLLADGDQYFWTGMTSQEVEAYVYNPLKNDLMLVSKYGTLPVRCVARYDDVKEVPQETCTFTATTLPAGCAEAADSCQKDGTTYYSSVCATCKSGFTYNEGICQHGNGVEFVYNNSTIKISAKGSAIDIFWGDGTSDTYSNSSATSYTHTYSESGEHTVWIGGNVTKLNVDTSSTPYITQLLNINLKSLQDASSLFSGAKNMTGNLGSMRLPSSLINGSGMFYNCSKLTGKIPTIPSGITNGRGMFNGCSGLTGSIPTLPSGLKDGNSMFEHCSGLTGSIPTLPSSLQDASWMFAYDAKLTGSIPALPSKLTAAQGMFSNCKSLTGSVPTLPNGITNGYFMFNECRGLTGSIPNIPSSMTKSNSMFRNCVNLTGDIPGLPNGITDATYMFSGCSNLNGSIKNLPSKLVYGEYMFQNCSKLTGSIPTLPSTLTNTTYMFYGCKGLSGTCPTKPSGLQHFSDMYENTNITCDYGK